MEKPHWRTSALALATAVLLGISASDANALALGRITVQSALGEPLRADIDVPEINAEEIASLRTGVASPQAFRAAGLEYNQTLANVQITLQRRPDGRYFLRLTSDRPVTDPFVDLILETTWSSGRIVRDYTMLFDPPNLRQAPAPAVAAQVPPRPAVPAATAPAPAAPARPPAVTGAPSLRPPAARPQSAAAPTPAPVPGRQAAAPGTPSGDGKQVTVRSGDTAGKIASANKPAEVSLDQMLVAMLRSNPDAFIAGNVNRLRAGAVLQVPSAGQAAAVGAGDASQTIVAQSRDFNEFRRRLAQGLPTTQVSAADRQASGQVQAKVDDKKPAAAAPDKLTLSKGTVPAGKVSEDQIARSRAAQDAATRVAELNKNIADLNKVGVAAAPATAAASKPGIPLATGPATGPASRPVAGALPAAPLAPMAAPLRPASAAVPAGLAPAPAVGPAPAPAPVVAQSAAAASAAKPAASIAAAVAAATSASASKPATAAASAAATTASAAAATASAGASAASAAAATASAAAATASLPAAAAPVAGGASAPKVVSRPAPAETSLIDDLLENPIVPAAIGGVLALLLGFGFYRARQRKKSTQVDSSFLESRLQPDSFFGASGGQRIDTAEGNATGSSMVYSPSQLDAAGDVDPVAEADVYLAYGRDLQAEEILKEALRTNPQRVAIHAKLLEIYSKRRDSKAFEALATEAWGLTRGEGPDWEHIGELGQELDPGNPLYRAGGQPANGIPAAVATGVAAAAGTIGAAAASSVPAPTAPASSASDLDLDLDFSLGDEPEPVSSMAAGDAERTVAIPAVAQAPTALDMDFGEVAADLPPVPELPRISEPEPTRLDAPGLTLSQNSIGLTAEPAKAPAPATAGPAAAADTGMIEFDLGALSLDLDSPAAPAGAKAKAAATEPDTNDAPLSTAGAPLSTTGFDDTGGDPLLTKLALAEEFNAIGDPDGARSLAQEVLAEASGDLKSRAQRFLAEIG